MFPRRFAACGAVALLAELSVAGQTAPANGSPAQPAKTATTRPVDATQAAVVPPGLHSADSAGVAVAFTTIGTGKSVVLFVHGWSCNQEFWNEQMSDAQLADGRTLVAVDLPGHGKSPAWPDGKYTIERFTDAMLAVLDALHAKQAVLVGHSNGTPMVRHFARLHPERTAALVAVDGALKNFFDDPAGMKRTIDTLNSPTYRTTAASMVDGMLPKTMPAERRDFIRTRMLAAPQATMIGDFTAVNVKEVWTEDPIRVPLLVVNARSPSWTPEYEAYVRKLAPQVDYQTMSDVSHFLMMDAPDEFDRRLMEFLEKNGL